MIMFTNKVKTLFTYLFSKLELDFGFKVKTQGIALYCGIFMYM